MATINLTSNSVAENIEGPFRIGTLGIQDQPDEALSFTLADNPFFEIVEVNGNGTSTYDLYVREGVAFDFEADRQFELAIASTDSEGNPVEIDNPVVVDITNANDNAPSDIRLNGGTSLDIPESTRVGSSVGELSATDADGDAIVSYQFAEEEENTFFEIVNDDGTWKVQLKQGVDYETVAQRQHVLRIVAKDEDNTSAAQEITINVTNINDNAPTGVALSAGSISESATVGDIVGELSATDADGDPISGYSLAAPSDFFEVDQVEGKWVVRLKAGVDYETASQRQHVLRITASDGTHTSVAQSFTIAVINENDNVPSHIRLDGQLSAEISEGATTGSIIGVLSATDADGNPVTGYQLVEQNTPFEVVEVDGRWVVRLKDGLDYEAQRHHVIRITATDGVNTSAAQDITINVTNTNDNAPTGVTLSATSISESAKPGDVVGTLSATDPDGDRITGYALAEQNDFFELVYESGAWQIRLKAGVDYENAAQREQVLKITATDGTRTSTVQEITIKVTNANEAPTGIVVTGGTIGDNAIIGAPVATLTGQDPDRGDLLTYMIVDETGVEYDHPYFGISGDQIVVKHDLGDAAIGSMPVYVKVTDANGLSHVQQVILMIEYVNKAPEVDHLLRDVLDGSQGGTVVAVISASDEEKETLTYRLTDTSAQWFTLIDNGDGTYNVVVKQGVILRSDRAAFQSFVIEVSDSANNKTTETIFLNINENLEPEATFEFIEVEKNTPAGTLVGMLMADDPEGQAVSYTLSGESAALFNLVRNPDGTYSVLVKQGVTLDYTDDAQHSFTVTVSDGFNSFEESFDLVFGNSLPKLTTTSVRVKEGVSGGTVVGAVSASDFDGDALAYSLSEVSSDLFELVRNTKGGYDIVVRAGVALDYENEDHHIVELEVSDGIDTVSKTLQINLTDVNEKPEVSFEATTISEDAAGGSVVGKLIVTDPENGALDCRLSAESAKLFKLVYSDDGTYEVVVRDDASLDYEKLTSHSFKMVLSDGDNSVEETIEIDLADVNEAPAITYRPVRVSEGAGSGSIIGSLIATDPEDDDVVYALNSEGSKLFDLMENEAGGYDLVVRQGFKLDYEELNQRKFAVTISDGENLVSGEFTVDLIDGVDTLNGTARVDSLNGTAGRDIIKGLAGNDSLVGNGGDDRLYGGAGKDVLNGGAGRDVFVFDSKPNKKTNLDKIVDFIVVDDSIWLENKIFSKLGKKGSEAAPVQLKKSMFALEKAKDKDDYIIYSKKTGKLFYDADGSGSKAAVEIATLSKKLAMTYEDFLVI